MIVLSHRGYWKSPVERNTAQAFERSFSLGFGTETDIRDHNGRLVISHDMPDGSAMPLETFFDIYNLYNSNLTLALNIKADGLQAELGGLLGRHSIRKYFVFDMAVPDALLYLRHKITTYTRHSEYEPTPPFYGLAQGVWLDEFNGQWINDQVIEEHLAQGKQICIVSPELHQREYINEWKKYRHLESRIGKDRLTLCTDFPELAQDFFNA